MFRIFYNIKAVPLLVFVGLFGCQHFPGPAVSPTDGDAVTTNADASKITWSGEAIQLASPPPAATERSTISEKPQTESATETSLQTNPQNIDPAIFLGKSTEHLTRALGLPSMLRKEGTVEVWQYQLSSCIIDFYLYDNGKTWVTTYTDMRSIFLGSIVDLAACMVDLNNLSQTTNTTR